MNINDYKYKVEMHAHTSPVSPCSDLSPKKMIALLSEHNTSAVVITNHFFSGYFKDGDKDELIEKYIKDYTDTARAGKEAGINVILGMEIRFTENVNDYLVYGINEDDVYRAYDYLDKGIDVFYKEFKTDKNVILQAHPFRDGLERANPESLDGIEAFNMHQGHNSRNSMAATLAKEHNLLVSCGTDFHHEYQAGACFALTDFVPKNSYDIAKIVKEQNFVFDVSGNIIIPRGRV